VGVGVGGTPPHPQSLEAQLGPTEM